MQIVLDSTPRARRSAEACVPTCETCCDLGSPASAALLVSTRSRQASAQVCGSAVQGTRVELLLRLVLEVGLACSPLLALLRSTAPDDDHLSHATRIALRNQLRDPAVLASLALDKQGAEDRALVLEMLLAASGEASAEFRMKFFENHEVLAGALFANHLPTLARNVTASKLESLFALAQRKLGKNPEALASGLDALLSALDQRGIPPGATLRSWGPQVVTALLSSNEPAAVWTNSPVDGAPPSAIPWAFEQRKCADGKAVAFMSSFPHGEKLTGTLRSPAFTLPASLSFFLCGHDGSPGKPAAKTNFVRLRDVQDILKVIFGEVIFAKSCFQTPTSKAAKA